MIDKKIRTVIISFFVLFLVLYVDIQIINTTKPQNKAMGQAAVGSEIVVCPETPTPIVNPSLSPTVTPSVHPSISPSVTPTLVPGSCQYYGGEGIRQAINAAPTGTATTSKTTILIKAGEYSVNSEINFSNKYLIIKGESSNDGKLKTKISSISNCSLFHPTGSSFEISKIHFDNTSGGAIEASDSHLLVYGNIFSGLIGSANRGSILVGGSSPVGISNNLIFGTKATGINIVTNNNKPALVFNNTIYDTGSGNCINLDKTGGADYEYKVINNICVKTAGYYIATDNTSFFAYNLSYLNSGTITPCNNNCLTIDPKFVNSGTGSNSDFHLRSDSPALHIGDSTPVMNNPDGSRSDIGAYGGKNACELDRNLPYCFTNKYYSGILVADKKITVDYTLDNKDKTTSLGYEAYPQASADKVVFLPRLLTDAYKPTSDAAGWNSGISIQNTEDRDTVVTLRLFKPDGSQTPENYDYNLPPYASKKIFIPSLTNPPNGVFSGRLNSSVTRIIADISHTSGDGQNTLANEAFSAVSLDKKYYISYLNIGPTVPNNLQSGIAIQNSGSNETGINIRIYDKDGNYKKTCSYTGLKPNATKNIYVPSDSCFNSLAQNEYSAEVTSTANVMINVSASFSRVGQSGSSFGEPAKQSRFVSTKYYVTRVYKDYYDRNTTLFINNLSDSLAEVSIKYYKPDGTEYVPSSNECKQRNINKNALYTIDINAKTCVPEGGTHYTAVVESNKKINVVYHISKTDYSKSMGFAALSDVEINGQKVYFGPRIYSNYKRWDSSFTVQNPNDSTVSLTVYVLEDSSGKYILQKTYEIASHATKPLFTPSAFPELPYTQTDPDATATNNYPSVPAVVPWPTTVPSGPCACSENICSESCVFNKYTQADLPGVNYNDPMKCLLPDFLFPTRTLPSLEDKNNWCKNEKRTKGNTDTIELIDQVDYMYYITAVNGGKIPKNVNPDFNGDGEVGAGDREIIIKSLTP